jgi:hypothetical protein
MDKYGKAARRNEGLYVNVCYSLTRYLGEKDIDIDHELERIAKKYGGSEFGSGGGFGGRDVNFGFTETRKARLFQRVVKTWAKKIRLKVNFAETTLYEYFGIGDES